MGVEWIDTEAAVQAILQKDGALAGGDFEGEAVVGKLAIDTTNGVLYICTAIGPTVWTVVGTQT